MWKNTYAHNHVSKISSMEAEPKMTELVEITHEDFKTATMKIFKDLTEKMNIMREMEGIKKEQQKKNF